METGTTQINRKKLVPWIIYLIFFAVLNETVFNVSTPKIALQFSLSPAGVSWMMTIFMVFFGIGMVVFGRLSDLYPMKRLIVIGILIYNAGSVMGFILQSSYPLVILSRAIQGMGGSAIPALVFTLVARYFAAEERGRVFGNITSFVSLAIGMGPVVGGFVSETFHWADLFLIPLLMLAAIPVFNRELPEEGRKPGQVDLPGAVLTALTVGFLVLVLNFGGWGYWAALGVSLAGLLLRLHWAKDPFIPPDLFENVKFRDGIVAGLLLFSVVIGVLFLVPLMLNSLHGLDTRTIGFVIFPGAMSSVFFGSYGGRLADRRGNPFVVVVGLSLLASGMGLMAFGLPFSFYVVGACMVLVYIGFSLFQTALVNSVSQTLTPEETGIGMGVFNLAGTLAGALGTAVVGKILAARWLGSSLWPGLMPERGAIYSNLLLIFCLIVFFSGGLYLYRYQSPKQAALKPEPAQTGE